MKLTEINKQLVSEFKIIKKNFYNMLSKISNYGSMINRDIVIENLLGNEEEG